MTFITVQFVAPRELVLNRILTAALAGMYLGLYGLFLGLRPVVHGVGRAALWVMLTGLGLMTLGNFVEYWILFRFHHQGSPGAAARGIAYMMFFLGALLMFGALTVAGAAMLRTRAAPAWLCLMFLLLLPLTGAFAFLGAGSQQCR